MQGLSFATEWQELKDLVRASGNVLRADVMKGPDGRSRGFGIVLFDTADGGSMLHPGLPTSN